MSDEQPPELNGSAKLILHRMDSMEDRQKNMERTLSSVRDHQLQNPPCPQPGLCLTLKDTLTLEHAEQANVNRDLWSAVNGVRKYVWYAVGAATCCSFLAGLVVTWLSR